MAVRWLQVVAETAVFSRDADVLLTAEDRDALIAEIARAPEDGDVIPGTGGLRKRRTALRGRGKRGGARVITYYLSERWPVYALFLYAKNERADLSAREKKVLSEIAAEIGRTFRRRERP